MFILILVPIVVGVASLYLLYAGSLSEEAAGRLAVPSF
jgi:hypothetical protein